MYVNHEDVGCMGDFIKEGCTTQHNYHTTYLRDLVPNNTYLQVLKEKAKSFKNLWIWGQILLKGEGMICFFINDR